MKRPLVFLDADVIFAGAASPREHGASHIVLTLGEMTLIECITSTQAVTEVERNMEAKLPSKLPELRLLVSRSLKVVPDPEPDELSSYCGQADPKDLPILVAGIQQHCDFLLTFNTKHFKPSSSSIKIRRPGEFLAAIRTLLTRMQMPE